MPNFKRESMDLDVLIVGAGPAGLSFAIHLTNLIENARSKGELKGILKSADFMLMVIEKSAEIGDHMLSGAVLDPIALNELIADWKELNAPVGPIVENDAMFWLTKEGKIKIPFQPPNMHNEGLPLVSLNQFVKWLGKIAEEKGVQIMTSIAGSEVIIEEGKFKGVITDDKGLDKAGNPKSNFEPGMELRAKLTILSEGPRGSLTRDAIASLNLDKGCNPQSYITGIKELWEIPKGRIKAGTVYHTLGYPLGTQLYGGGWIYAMSDELISIGFASALNAKDPRNDPHRHFQDLKKHPFINSLLKGGKMIRYGAKTISEGGYWAMPRLYADGLMIIGEAGGFLNSMRLKGIHLAMKSGMMAAETAFDALSKEDYTSITLKKYEEHFHRSWSARELYRVRNFHQPLAECMFTGFFHTGLQLITNGRGIKNRYSSRPDHTYYEKLTAEPKWSTPLERKFDGELTFDKLTDVFASGTKHEENQPCHLKILDLTICEEICTKEYGNPCQHFCPAQVYEIIKSDDGTVKLQLNPSNCLHCKTCDIADPYQNIKWVPPEGGGGPKYGNM